MKVSRYTRLERWLGIERLLRSDILSRPDYSRPKVKFAKSTKQRIYAEQGGFCFLCRQPMTMQQEQLPSGPQGQARSTDATWDHIHPLILGGDNKLGNMALAHHSCNNIKGQLPCVDLTTAEGRSRALAFHHFIAGMHACQPLRKVI